MTRVFTVMEAQNSKIEDNVPATVESEAIMVEDNVEQGPESKAKFAIDDEKTKSLLTREQISKQLVEIVFNRNTENTLDSLGWKNFLLYSMIGKSSRTGEILHYVHCLELYFPYLYGVWVL